MMRPMDATDDLRLLLASRHALILAAIDDEQRFLGVVRGAALVAGYPVWTWSLTRGLARDGFDPQVGTSDPRKGLDFVTSLHDPGVFVFVDVQAAFADPLFVRKVKELAMRATTGQTLVLAGPRVKAPPELDGLALAWSLEPPTREETEALVRRTVDDLIARGFPVGLDAAAMSGLVEAVRGLTLPEAERLVLRGALRDGKLDSDDVAYVRGAKAELLEAEGILELVASDERGLDAVGGLEHLKEWLRIRGRAFEPAAREFGLDPPRGVLLTGVPGCGKSLVAKTLARTWGLSLVLLDPGRLYGPYVGESESRLEGALATVEAMAPAVLWVDEIEKGFAAGTSGGDSGVSQRVLGSFLRWMQDRPPGVFVVATSNDVMLLPPELLRRGRFDEIFFVDLPRPDERAAILRILLESRGRDPSAFDVDALATASDGCSGAELEGAIVAAMYRAYADARELTTDDVATELAATVPLSRTRAEDVSALRSWGEGRAVPASRAEPTG
jgi:AAA+ superfamily predicted ATPase